MAHERKNMRERLASATVDALGALLDGPRARDAFVLRVTMASPWSISVQDRAPLAVLAVVGGRTWVVPGGDAEPVCLLPGDVAVVRGPGTYVIADTPERAPLAVVLEGERCVALDGAPLDTALSQGVRTWGNSAEGPDVLLVGAYQVEGEVSRRLLGALPELVVVRSGDVDDGDPLAALVDLLGVAVDRGGPGHGAVLDRMLDLVLIGALRSWFASHDTAAPRWYRAEADPIVGVALRLLHHNPGRSWTVATLASAAGVSRATLARRFAALVGEPPMTYLARWRLTVAADRLRDPGATVASVAAEVGYGSAFALSTAFKRQFGTSPSEHRKRDERLPSPTPGEPVVGNGDNRR